MAMVVIGLMKDAHQARGAVRALDDAGFGGEDIDVAGGSISALVERGVPDREAHVYAEGVRRGGALVCVRADDAEEGAEAALIMSDHGALDIHTCRDPRRSGAYGGPERRVGGRPYAGVNRRAA